MTRPDAGRERLLGAAFVRLADTLVEDYDVIELLDRLVGYCLELLDVEAAAIVLGDPDRELGVVASTSGEAELLGLLELRSGQGPAVDCYRTGARVSVPDLARTGDRWPRFARALRGRVGYRCLDALPLRLRGEAVGVLNLFHRRTTALTAADADLAQSLADVATIGILQERAIRRGEVRGEQLQVALNSRVVIEQAKGVIAEHHGVGMAEAFDRLRSHARATNGRLGEVARRVVEGDPAVAALLTPRGGDRW